MDGILRCSRYSFGPNRLHYCGPDANSELREYIKAGTPDSGLEIILKQFKTLFPYLREISSANKIQDPFDSRVVEAYWLGNNLLKKAGEGKLHRFLVEGLNIKELATKKDFKWIENKISQGALPHHSFHVFNIWRQTSKEKVSQDIWSMDECRVSSGTIMKVNGPYVTVKTEPLTYRQGKFALGEPILKNLIRSLETEYDIEQLKPGQIVSIHWSVPCEVITKKQAAVLKKYTIQSIAFANQTI